MSHPACRSCKGSGKFYSQNNKSYDCRACGGYGVNRDLYETSCDRCRRSLIYKVGQQAPRFCKDCRNIDLEKRCEQSGCTNIIRYKVGWDNVSSYCRRCQGKRQEGASASTCPGTGVFMCGKLIWSPRGKTFQLCPDCSAKQKAEREAKMREKPCADCGKTLKYSVDQQYQPNFCAACKEKRQTRHEPNQSENPRFYAACGNRGANLTREETDRFSDYFHKLPDRQRMSFQEIVDLANEWKKSNAGGFRRSDRR